MVQVYHERHALLLQEKCGFTDCHEYLEYVYTAKEKKAVSKEHDIRLLSMDALDYVVANYDEGEDYCGKLLKYGMLYGYFIEDKLVGFVGDHFMGAAGILFVDESMRGRGIAQVLVQFIINKTLERGNTLYCFVAKGNEASHKLQQKMGMYPASKYGYLLY